MVTCSPQHLIWRRAEYCGEGRSSEMPLRENGIVAFCASAGALISRT